MSKIAIVADLHYGVPGRLRDIDWAARAVMEYCTQQGIDTVLILGDLTHDRTSVGLDVWNTLYDLLNQARARDQKWYVFPGNHDMFLKYSWNVTSLRPLRELITVMDDTHLMTIDDRRFWVLPFIHLEQSYMKALAKLQQRYEQDDTLLTHIGVRGSTLNTCFLLKDWSYVTFEQSPFRRVFTGHFHSHQTVGENVIYPGSPIPFKADEGDVEHGFIVLDTDTMTHEFVDLWKVGAALLPGEPLPHQYFTVLYDQVPTLQPELIRGNIIRVAHQEELMPQQRQQLLDQLRDMGVKSVRFLAVTRTGVPVIDTAPLLEQLHDPAELFQRWLDLDQPKLPERERAMLLQLNQDVRTDGDYRYEQALNNDLDN